MDSVVSWAILTGIVLVLLVWLLLARVRYLDSVHVTKEPCVLANARHGKDWQAYATGHTKY